MEDSEYWNENDADMDVDPPENTNALNREPFSRCIVKKIIKTSSKQLLIVEINTPAGTEERRVILTQCWKDTELSLGDVINVIGTFILPESGSCNIQTITLTLDANLMILWPDLYLSVTEIASAKTCSRRTVINALTTSHGSSASSSPSSTTIRHGASVGREKAAALGKLLHKVIQRSMKGGKWDENFIEESIKRVLESPEGLNEVVRVGMSIEEAKRSIKDRKAEIQGLSRFVGQTLQPDAELTDPYSRNQVKFSVALTKFHGVEEDICSRVYGVTGKLDASVQALLKPWVTVPSEVYHPTALGQGCSWKMPLEIKTGNVVVAEEHRAQTSLYTLLLSERYNEKVPCGLLYYTQSGRIVPIFTSQSELRDLIIRRNAVASFLMPQRRMEHSMKAGGKALLPATIDDEYECSNCAVVDGCMLFRKSVEDVTDTSSPIFKLYEKKIGHLTAEQRNFYKRWEALLSHEEQCLVTVRKHLWADPVGRKKKGDCFTNMVLREDLTHGSQASKHTYCFSRANSPGLVDISNAAPDVSTQSLLYGLIQSGDAVTVSIEPNNAIAWARGRVVKLEHDHIIIRLDRKFDIEAILHSTHSINDFPEVLHRIEKDDYLICAGRLRDNLARLFYEQGDKRRLSLIVDLEPPSFDSELVPDDSVIPQNLSDNQRDVVRKVLSSKDYCIVRAIPGTGAANMIATLINILVNQGKTVLIASYRHDVVDNILRELGDVDYQILRLGSPLIDLDFHKYMDHIEAPKTTELQDQILGPPVVATTCLDLNHTILSRYYFDFCIIDKASQCTLPTCLGPLRYADKFVLFGDHFQLLPYVRDVHARNGGLEVSLFRRLMDAHPKAVVTLTSQHHIHEHVAHLSRVLIYNRRETIYPDLEARHASVVLGDGLWTEMIKDKGCGVIFIDTDTAAGREFLKESDVGIQIICDVVDTLLQRLKIDQSDIGVISPYRTQVDLLSTRLSHWNGIKFFSVGQSQGVEKDYAIVYIIRTDENPMHCKLMKDWRRLNVSFTRARSKLIIIGSCLMLRNSGFKYWEDFFDFIVEEKWLSQPYANPVLASGIGASSSNRGRTINLNDKENITRPRISSTPTKNVAGILKGRPLMQDIVNNQLCQ